VVERFEEDAAEGKECCSGEHCCGGQLNRIAALDCYASKFGN